MQGARAFKEADLLQWLKDNSDFEDEEKVQCFCSAEAICHECVS